MKNSILLLFLLSLLTLCCNSFKKEEGKSNNDILKYENYFSEIKTLLDKENGKLWGTQLYGPILLVDTKTRTIFANEGDDNGYLTAKGKIYSGKLPDELNIANTAFDWNGKRWTMLMLPLPEDKDTRLSLLTHELFHRIQPVIGFDSLFEKTNSHLDEYNGRILIKLELEALRKALNTEDQDEINEHLINAMIFRKYRHDVYEYANETENVLELNEGLAEFTGVIVAYNDNKKLIENFNKAIDRFYNNKTFVRSFAYQTLPIYGFFIYQEDKEWNKKISKETDLTSFIINFFKFSFTNDLEAQYNQIKEEYGFISISQVEKEREAKKNELIALYEKKFIHDSVLVINLQNMNISYDPRNIMPLKEYGTVYPNLRLTDNWGILTVKNGALINNMWNKVTVSAPIEIGSEVTKGDGWELQLNEDYEIVEEGKNYTIKKL